MVGLAGRMAGLMSKIPGRGTGIYHDLGGAALGAGLTTLGNVVTGQADEKPAARLIAEALGGGLAGYGVSKLSRPIREKMTSALQAGKVTGIVETPIGGFKVSPLGADRLLKATNLGARGSELGSIAMYGGLGGLIGGGAANIALVPQTNVVNDGDDIKVAEYLAAIQASDPMVVG
jgi:hypothetical protein